MEQYIVQAFMVALGIGGVSLTFKWLLGELSKHVDRLEHQWERYTDKLTEAMSSVHRDVNKIRDELHEHMEDEDSKRAAHTERLSEEISEIRSLMEVVNGTVR